MTNVQIQEIDYSINGEPFKGVFAIDKDLNQTASGVLIVHEWWGNGADDHVASRIKRLAEQGYAAFALDMFGKDKTADNPTDAEALMNATFAAPDIIPSRFDAALDWLHSQDSVDSSKTAAIGYCYGGAVVLNMARAGKPINTIASFHGLLETESPMQEGVFNGEIAVFTGEDDPMVSPDILQAFDDEMEAAAVNCSITAYPKVLHGFTNPHATARGEKFGFPLKYDEAADNDSWQATLELFERTLKT